MPLTHQTAPANLTMDVAKLRKQAQLTQRELAAKLGVSMLLLRKIEHAEVAPSPELVDQLQQLFGVAVAADRAITTSAIGTETTILPSATAPDALMETAVTEIGQGSVSSTLGTDTQISAETGNADRAVQDRNLVQTRKVQRLLEGQEIRGYRFFEAIGRGGFGAVYRARQLSVGRDVAIKVINPDLADDPEFIRRFEAEAELVASLEHPFIVPLYDFWREPGAAFMVMRLLKGGSLAQAIQDRRVDGMEPIAILRQLAQALHAAHRAEIVHRDLKPANVLLDDQGHCCLADFGVAKQLKHDSNHTQAGDVVGSLAYCSPEQLRGVGVGPASDIYALGLLAFELFSGRRPFSATTRDALIYQQLYDAPPLLREFVPTIPERADGVIQKALAKDAAQRYQDALSFVHDLDHELRDAKSGWMGATHGASDPGGLTSGTSAELLEQDNPFVGLAAFDEANAKNFFGRESLIESLVTRLQESVLPRASGISRSLFVIGPSGSGKSSVVRAGLLPALRAGAVKGSERWLISTMMPGEDPLQSLAQALLRVASTAPEGLHELLASDRSGLARAIDRSLAPNTELLLLVDQFEELFTLCTDSKIREQWIAIICNAMLEPYSRLRVVFTLRADFLDRPLQQIDLAELLQQRTEMVPAMTLEELERAVVGPAKRAGLVFEPGLVAAILADMGEQSGALPMLQYALAELFRQRNGRELTLAGFRHMGGIRGALANRAESTYQTLDADAQAASKQLFLRLTTLGEGREDTRRRAFSRELEALFADPAPLIKARESFANARLLSYDRDQSSGKTTVEVAHEALLRNWPQLQDWLASSRSDLRLQRQLADATKIWRDAKAQELPSDGFLASSARLAQFLSVRERGNVQLTGHEQAFLDASVSREQAIADAEKQRQARELAQAQALAEQERQYAKAATERASADRRSKARLQWMSALLSLILVFALWQSLQLDRRSKALQVQTKRANIEATSANALSEFWRSLFKNADPNQAKGKDLTVREILDQGLDQAKNLSDAPMVKAKLLLQMGESYRSLGQLDSALSALQQAQAAITQLDQDTEVIATTIALQLEQGRVLADLARSTDALAALEKARSLQTQINAPALDRATTLNIIASIYNDQNRYLEAEPLLRETLALRQSGASEDDLITTHNNLGFTLLQVGHAKDAREQFLIVLEKRKALFGPLHSEVAIAYMNLANTERDMGEFEAAVRHYQEVESILQQLYGQARTPAKHPPAKHPLFAALASNRGAVYLLSKQTDLSLAAYQEAVDIYRANQGQDTPSQSGALLGLARAQILRGDLAIAKANLEAALRFAELRVGAGHQSLAPYTARLADVCLRMQQVDAAQVWLQQTETLLQNAPSGDLKLSTEKAALLILRAQINKDPNALATARTLLEPAQELVRARELLADLAVDSGN
jgi:serine/threonine protein kinase/DNA-binding XRE family transcriptional regulator